MCFPGLLIYQYLRRHPGGGRVMAATYIIVVLIELGGSR